MELDGWVRIHGDYKLCLTHWPLVFVNHADRLSGGVLLVIAILAWLEAIHLPFGSIHQPDAGFFPKVLSVLLFLTSVTIIAHSFVKGVDVVEFSRRSWLVPIAAGVLIGYALVLPTAGYILTTTVIMLLIMRGLAKMAWLRAFLSIRFRPSSSRTSRS